MSLPYAIPSEKPYPWSVGYGTGFERGWAVWSVQRAINRFHASWNEVEDRPIIPDLVDEDFVWGNVEAEAVKRMQHLLRLTEDGVAGMATQRRVVKYFTGDVVWLEPSRIYRERYASVPAGLLHSISYGEMVYLLGGASWNSAENIDLGAFQDNVQDAGLEDLDRVKRAFDIRAQVGKKAGELVKWVGENGERRGCAPAGTFDSERAFRRAAMSHNRPLDGAVLARFPLDELDSDASVAFEKQWVGIPGYDPDPWGVPLKWVIARGCTFPGTTHKVETRLDWVRFYALGRGKASEPNYWRGLVCRYVTDWTP